MSIAALIRAMGAGGASIELITLAVEAVEQAELRARSTRAHGAERVRRYRARKAAEVTDNAQGNVTVTAHVTPDVTGDEAKVPLVPPVSPKENIKPPLTPQTPPKPHTPPARAAAPKLAKQDFHRLPDDWQPGPLPASLAASEPDWPPGWLDAQADRFRAWAANAADTDGKGRKLKWDSAFHNWLRDNGNGNAARNGTPAASNRQPGGDRPHSPTVSAAIRLQAKFGTAAHLHQSGDC